MELRYRLLANALEKANAEERWTERENNEWNEIA